MKRSALCILTLFALLVTLPLAAQMGTEETERTNPDAPSIAPHSGLTLQGTVTSWNDRELVLETESGVEHLVLTRDLNLPASLSKGDQVAVDYTRNSQGTMIANEVRPIGDVEASAQVTTSVAAETEPQEAESYGSEPMAQEESETMAASETATDSGMDDELPATGGNEPLILLLGAVAVAGAAGLKLFTA